jgi:hypothetical protein
MEMPPVPALVLAIFPALTMLVAMTILFTLFAGASSRASPVAGQNPIIYQAYGWLYHGDQDADPSGIQLAFAITGQQGPAPPAIRAVGAVWNELAGQDVTFEIPGGLSSSLLLAPDQLNVDGLPGLQTARLPARFTDRSDPQTPTSHLGTVTFVLEGAGDVYGFQPIDSRFAPEGAGWSVEFRSAGAVLSRLARLSVSLDCPDLGIFQLAVSDWEGDYAELFYGLPLSIEVSVEVGS